MRFTRFDIPQAQMITPLVYDEALSYEQQIARLRSETCKISERLKQYLQIADFNAFLTQLEGDQAEQTTELKAYADAGDAALRTELVRMIDQIMTSMQIWDVTLGRFNDNIESMRDIFNDVTLHSVTVDALAESEWTVDTLTECGLNVRGLAVYSGAIMGEGFTPEGVLYEPPTETDAPTEKLTAAMLATALVNENGVFVAGDRGGSGSTALDVSELSSANVGDGGIIYRDE